MVKCGEMIMDEVCRFVEDMMNKVMVQEVFVDLFLEMRFSELCCIEIFLEDENLFDLEYFIEVDKMC